MSEIERGILELWPAIKEDLGSFLSDTDAWIITELKNAHQVGDWKAVSKIIEIMEFVHGMHHSH